MAICFAKMIHNTENLVGELVAVLDNDKVILLQRDGSGQFSAVPLKLRLPESRKMWWLCGELRSQKKNFATRTLRLNIVHYPKFGSYTRNPDPSSWNLDPNACSVNYCAKRPSTEQSLFAMCPQTSYLSQWISPSLVWYLLLWCIEEW